MCGTAASTVCFHKTIFLAFIFFYYEIFCDFVTYSLVQGVYNLLIKKKNFITTLLVPVDDPACIHPHVRRKCPPLSVPQLHTAHVVRHASILPPRTQEHVRSPLALPSTIIILFSANTTHGKCHTRHGRLFVVCEAHEPIHPDVSLGGEKIGDFIEDGM